MKRLLLFLCLLAQPLSAATYYIAPGLTGNDANPGTSGSPYRTFAYALAAARFAAGDTLLLKDGTYSLTVNGNGTRFISTNCASGANANGTLLLPITVRAENERLAFLSSDGTGALVYLNNCSYWSVEGLRAQSADKTGTSESGFFYALSGSHNSFKRNLLSFTNRYRNESLITMEGGSFGLLEENEIYSFHRNGMTFVSGHTGGVMRRNYSNSRSRADVASCGAGCSSAIDGSRGDDAFVCYPCVNGIFENNISENSAGGFTVQDPGPQALGNEFLGNIDIGSGNAIHFNNRVQSSTAGTPTNTVLQNNLGLNNTSIAFYLRTSCNTTGDGNTAIGATLDGFTWDRETTLGVCGGVTGNNTFFFDNSLSFNNGRYGFNISNQFLWLLDYPNSYNNTTAAFTPAASDPSITNETTTNPAFGSCKAWVPAASPMKSTGKTGKDKGANILYQYLNGVLTSVPLWNTSGGSINNFTGCGVVVTGVNDTAGSSCTDVDVRLSVGTANGCDFPSGYGTAGAAGGTWLATDNFDSYTIGNTLNAGAGGSGWSGNWTEGTAAVTVQTAPTGGQDGGAFYVNSDPNFSYSRAFSNISAGIVSFRFWIDLLGLGDAIFFLLDETGTGRGLVSMDPDGFVKIFDGTSRTNIGPWTAGAWHTVTIEFDDAAQANTFRAKVDAGVFSQWQPAANGGSYSVINGVRIRPENTTLFNGQLYIDDIKEGSTSSLISTIALVDSGLSGSTMFVASTRALQWSSTDLTGNIDLLVSRDAGLTFQMIAPNVPNTGSYNWTVTGPSSTQCRVKVRSSSTPAVFDDSETFSISGTRLTVR